LIAIVECGPRSRRTTFLMGRDQRTYALGPNKYCSGLERAACSGRKLKRKKRRSAKNAAEACLKKKTKSRNRKACVSVSKRKRGATCGKGFKGAIWRPGGGAAKLGKKHFCQKG